MKYFKTRILLMCLLISCAGNVHAVWYQVELILFEYLSPETDGEYWYSSPGLAPLSNTIRLRSPELIKRLEAAREETELPSDMVLFPTLEAGTGDGTTSVEDVGINSSGVELIPYSLLPDDNKRLEAIYRVLSLSSDYKPFYHITWQQPGLDIDQTRPVHIQMEDPVNLFEITIPANLVTDPMPADFYEPIKLLIDGTIRIRSTLYLHVDMDLVMFKPPPARQEEDNENILSELDDASEMIFLDDSGNPGLVISEIVPDPELLDPQDEPEVAKIKVNKPVEYVRLMESRRIRLNELHYFDHPLFGAIIQVSRYGEEDQDF